MRTLLFLATFLAVAPLVTAGPGASVQTLDSSSGCQSYGGYSQGGNSTPDGGYQYRSYWYHQQCDDHQNVAAVGAHDNNGEVASASAGNQHGNSSDWNFNDHESWNNQSWQRSQGSYYSNADQWARGARVSSRAGNANVSDGCGRQYSHGSSSYQESDSYWGNRGNTYQQNSYDSSCSEGASSNIIGTPASAGIANSECRSQDRSNSGYWQNSYGYQSYHQAQRDDSCFSGPSASAEGETLRAGFANGCRMDEWSYSSSYSSTNNRTWSRCDNGLVAQGPDGASFFLGQRDVKQTECENSDCTSRSGSDLLLEMDWEHDPVQPYPIVVGVPLP